MDNLIHQVMSSKGSYVEVIEPDAVIDTAVERMSSRHVGSLLVIDGDKLVGMITERDLLTRVLAERRDPMVTSVREVMTRDVAVVSPTDTIRDAMLIVTRRKCRHLAVVEDTRICGLVSAGDLTAWLVREQQQTIDDLHDYIRR